MINAAISPVEALVALVVRMRGWDDQEVRRAIAAGQSAGWRSSAIALDMVRLAVTDGTEPGQLTGRRPKGRRRKPLPFAAVQAALGQLEALCAMLRPDWDAAEVHVALVRCHESGWPFAQAALEVVRLAVIPESEPRDLAAAAGNPYSRRTVADHRG